MMDGFCPHCQRRLFHNSDNASHVHVRNIGLLRNGVIKGQCRCGRSASFMVVVTNGRFTLASRECLGDNSANEDLDAGATGG
jgi:hypothetical protein